MLAGWVSLETHLLDLQTATFLLCPHMAFLLWTLLVSLPLPVGASELLDQGAIFLTSFNLHHLFKRPLPKCSHMERGGGVGPGGG